MILRGGKMQKQGSLLDICNHNGTKKKTAKRNKKDFFDKFDQGTCLKLDLLERSVKSWLPVFITQNFIEEINLVDFFAGEGKDSSGKKGSPLKIIDTIQLFSNLITKREKGLTINLHFNDDNQDATERLKVHLKKIKDKIPVYVDIIITSKTYEDLFEEILPSLKKNNVANFLFIDPFGLALTRDHFQIISSLRRTDFILFTPVTNVQRFCEQNGFKQHFPGLKRSYFEDPKTAHRKLCEYIKINWVIDEYYLHSFAIQKAKGHRHCLIFGSRNKLGVYKFIESCWKEDPENGESNFSFEGDLRTEDCPMIPELAGSQKIKNFQASLDKLIRQQAILSNQDIFDFALNAGFHPPSSHVKDVLKKLKKDKVIKNNLSRFGLSYNSVDKGLVDLEFITYR